MNKQQIVKLVGREILDSRGNPTLEASVVLEDGTCAAASVPSGASTGKFEAHERRDGDAARYGGKGVLQAVHAVNHVIAPALMGMAACSQEEVDRRMLELDGTANKSKIGANAILAVSLAVARASAHSYHVPLFRHIGGTRCKMLPCPMMNILNGGAHATNNIDIQEFMIVPTGAQSFAEALQIGSEIYHALGEILRARGLSTAVGDEGGFAPDLNSERDALDLLVSAIRKAGYDEQHVKIALDVAASEWQDGEGGYLLPKRGTSLDSLGLIDYLESLVNDYPIVSIEDGLGEEDYGGWGMLTERLGKRVMLVGDDLFVTNETRLARGIKEGLGNSILIKPNQIGTLTETLGVIDTAQRNGYKTILSHRSGETEDTSIADIAVACGAPFIKSGAPCRTDRVAKYNRLLRIEGTLQAASRALGKRGEGTACAFRHPELLRL